MGEIRCSECGKGLKSNAPDLQEWTREKKWRWLAWLFGRVYLCPLCSWQWRMTKMNDRELQQELEKVEAEIQKLEQKQL